MLTFSRSSMRHLLFLILSYLFISGVLPLSCFAVPIPQKAQLQPKDMALTLLSDHKIWDSVLPIDNDTLLLQAPAWLGNTDGQLYILDKAHKLSLWPNEEINLGTKKAPNSQHFKALAGITKDQENHIWVLDSGVPRRNQPPVATPQIYEFDPVHAKMLGHWEVNNHALEKGSILNGIAVWKNHVFMADSGQAAVVYLDTHTGISHRYLAHNFLLTAVHPLEGQHGVVTNKDGQAVAMDVSMIAISPDGQALYMQAPTGRLIRVVTSVLLDPQISPTELEEGLTGWYITPHLGGLTVDKNDTLYWSDISTGSIISYTKGRIPHRIIQDSRLQWPTTPGISEDGKLYVTASQVDRSSAFGKPSTIDWPIAVYELQLPSDSLHPKQ